VDNSDCILLSIIILVISSSQIECENEGRRHESSGNLTVTLVATFDA